MMLQNVKNRSLYWEVALGLLAGGVSELLTFMVERFPAENSALRGTVVAFSAPGLIGAAIVSGNVHAPPLWIAALINGLIYFGLGWLAGYFIARLARNSRI